MLLIIGTDDALLEGLAQSLAGTGQRIAIAHSLDEGAEVMHGQAPLMLIAHRSILDGATPQDLARVPLAGGGVIVAYRGHNDPPDLMHLPLPTSRLTMAELELPLERTRLVALAAHVATRAQEVGRAGKDTPPESPAS